MENFSLQGTHSTGACAFPRTVKKLEKTHIETSVAKKQLGLHMTSINNYAHSLKAGRKPSHQKVVTLLDRLIPYSDIIVNDIQRCAQVRSLLREVLAFHDLRAIEDKYVAAIEKIEAPFLGDKERNSMKELLRLNRVINSPDFREENYFDGSVSQRSKVLALLPVDCIITSIPWA